MKRSLESLPMRAYRDNTPHHTPPLPQIAPESSNRLHPLGLFVAQFGAELSQPG